MGGEELGLILAAPEHVGRAVRNGLLQREHEAAFEVAAVRHRAQLLAVPRQHADRVRRALVEVLVDAALDAPAEWLEQGHGQQRDQDRGDAIAVGRPADGRRQQQDDGEGADVHAGRRQQVEERQADDEPDVHQAIAQHRGRERQRDDRVRHPRGDLEDREQPRRRRVAGDERQPDGEQREQHGDAEGERDAHQRPPDLLPHLLRAQSPRSPHRDAARDRVGDADADREQADRAGDEQPGDAGRRSRAPAAWTSTSVVMHGSHVGQRDGDAEPERVVEEPGPPGRVRAGGSTRRAAHRRRQCRDRQRRPPDGRAPGASASSSNADDRRGKPADERRDQVRPAQHAPQGHGSEARLREQRQEMQQRRIDHERARVRDRQRRHVEAGERVRQRHHALGRLAEARHREVQHRQAERRAEEHEQHRAGIVRPPLEHQRRDAEEQPEHQQDADGHAGPLPSSRQHRSGRDAAGSAAGRRVRSRRSRPRRGRGGRAAQSAPGCRWPRCRRSAARDRRRGGRRRRRRCAPELPARGPQRRARAGEAWCRRD